VQDVARLPVQGAEVQHPPVHPQAPRLLVEHLAAGEVDEVDAAADDQDVRLQRALAGDGVEPLGDVVDRAEKIEPSTRTKLELRALRSGFLAMLTRLRRCASGSGTMVTKVGWAVRLR